MKCHYCGTDMRLSGIHTNSECWVCPACGSGTTLTYTLPPDENHTGMTDSSRGRDTAMIDIEALHVKLVQAQVRVNVLLDRLDHDEDVSPDELRAAQEQWREARDAYGHAVMGRPLDFDKVPGGGDADEGGEG